MKFHKVMLVFVLSCLSLRLYAQEATEEAPQGWPIVERCIGEPTNPPADWSFEGTILATGWAGIHGINADWETPQVLAFRVSPRRSYWYVNGTAISENGHWYSELFWEEVNTNSIYGGSRIKELRVSSLINLGEMYNVEFPTDIRYEWDTLFGRNSGGVKPFWWDENHVLVINDLVNPFTGEIIPPQNGRYSEYPNDDTLSPDRTRAVQIDYGYQNAPYALVLLDTNPIEYSIFGDGWVNDVQWKSDSSSFVARVGTNHNTAQLILFDKDGNVISLAYASEGLLSFGHFSNNSHYLPIWIDASFYIADIEEMRIYDTCLSNVSSKQAWSPFSNQLAFVESGDGQKPVLILDLEDWRLYNTGIYHDGDILFWRAD